MARPSESMEKVKETLRKTHGDNIIILEYSGSNKPGKFLCNICKNIWEVKFPSKVINKTGCPKCSRDKDKLSFEYVKNKIELSGCQLVSDHYENATSKLLIEFSCGHRGKISWRSFKDGSRCYICGIKTRSNSHRTKEENIIKFLEDNGFKFVCFPNGYKRQRESFVQYSCGKGHITNRSVMNIYKYPTCKQCEFEDLALLHTGSGNSWWKGGATEISLMGRNNIANWKKQSMMSCNYKCIITGEPFDNIHHLYGFNLIVRDALKNLNMVYDEKRNNYTEEEMLLISSEINRVHDLHPLGVCLREDVHDLFHKMYGVGDNTPDQWFEFVEKINSKEIVIGKEE